MNRSGRATLLALFFFLTLLGAIPARAQSSQAALQGQVSSPEGMPVARALILLRNLATNAPAYRYTNEQGLYYFSAVPPGSYTVRVDALGYRPEQRLPVELPVAARVELNFALQALVSQPAPPPSPPARAGARPEELLATMYGADAAVPQAVLITLPLVSTETLAGSLSSLIDENEILELPLSGRDVYTLLVMQPGVTSDNAAGRGLGFSIHGQRAGSSHFLLDGVDNNDLLVTGPATRVSADAVQEYRMNTSNYTAEFGKASGFIANAITRSGTNGFHGTLFEFFNHDRLNANSFSYNWQDVSRPPFRQNQFGGTLGGPLRRDRLFFFGSIERARTSSQSQPLWVVLPSPELVSLLSVFPDETPAKIFFSKFPPPAGDPIPGLLYFASKDFVLPAVEANTFALGRLDYTFPNSNHRLSGRYAFSQQTLENFFFSVYEGFNAPLEVRSQNLAVNYTRELSGGSNELKFGYNRSSSSARRPHPEIPAITSSDFLLYPNVTIASPDFVSGGNVSIPLPGMDLYSDYFFRGTSVSVIENFSRLVGKHALGLGLDWRLGFSDSLYPLYRSGYYEFADFEDFFLPGYPPSTLILPLNRQTGLPGTEDDHWSFHRQNDLAVFLQDNLKLAPRLTVNLGLRYEYFGVPVPRKTTRDWNFVVGDGPNVPTRIASGRIESGELFRPDRNNFAPRFGFALDLLGTGKSVIRGGYGIFYDRIFNNVWLNTRNNNLPLQFLDPTQFRFSIPAVEGLQPVKPEFLANTSTVAVDRQLRTPYVQSWFLGIQQEITPNLLVEVNQVGSLGRKLITSDGWNRGGSVARTRVNPHGRYNPNFTEIIYYGNQGDSDHLALEAALRRRWRGGLQLQLAYTFSRSRDVQSDPLVPPRLQATAISNPFTRHLAASNLDRVPAFTRQFDPQADYGKSDFDQTHNLVLNTILEIPKLSGLGLPFGGWQVAGLLGIRSGLPFTVFSFPGSFPGERGVFTRADFLGKSWKDAFLPHRPEIAGGVQLLNREMFAAPAQGWIGRLPRNALRGPGFWNADVSINRSFFLPRWSERAWMQLRFEFYNLFNHTNLNNPDSLLEWYTFGSALYGRQGASSALPSVSPLNEQPRRVQVAVKIHF